MWQDRGCLLQRGDPASLMPGGPLTVAARIFRVSTIPDAISASNGRRPDFAAWSNCVLVLRSALSDIESFAKNRRLAAKGLARASVLARMTRISAAGSPRFQSNGR